VSHGGTLDRAMLPDMLRALLQREVLVCPTCRRLEAGALVDRPLVLGEVHAEAAGRPWQGMLCCPGCGTRYPIVDGVPVVLRDVAGWIRAQERSLLWRDDLAPGLASWLQAAWPDHEDPGWKRELLATYTRDLDEIPPGGVGLPAALAEAGRGAREFLAARRVALVAEVEPGALAVDLGAGVGVPALHFAQIGLHAVALEREFGPLRLLSRLLRDGRARVPRMGCCGGDFSEVELALPPGTNPSRVLPLAADALDPPFRARTFAVVTAYNLLDNVENPPLLLQQAGALLAPGGHLAVSSPYDWTSRVTPLGLRLGAAIHLGPEPDPAQALRDLLAGRLPGLAPGLALTLGREEPRLPWLLQRHDRSWHLFFTHYLEARRGG